MKLLTARVRHYRIVRDSGLLRLDSPSGLALLAAPNESGKSTLIEAIHTCLFVAHRTGGEGFLGSIRPKPGTGEHPEVELSFEAGGGKYSLRKVFKGGRTSVAELTQPGGAVLTGEEAERKLAELTGHAPGNAAGREQAWAHLWVWQGTAGDDPLGESLPKDRLDQRLAREGAGGVLRSETDSRVMAQVEELWGQVYTANNRVKVTSELHKAAESLAEARNRQAQATAELSRMEADIVAKEDVLRRLEEARVGLERVEPEWQRNLQQVATLGDLRQQHVEAERKLETAAQALASLVRADRDIIEKQAQAEALRSALEPAERAVQAMMEEVRASEARQKELSAETKRLAEIEETARLKRELAQACAELLEREKNLARLEALQAEAETLDAEIAGIEEQLARLPPVDDRTLGRLQDLEKRCLLAEASLKAMALELEVVRADQTVSLSGTLVAPGTTALVTCGSELMVGDGVVIRLSPGGADTLAQTGQEVERARCALAEALGKCQVESLAIAGRVREQRAELEAKLAGARRQHQSLGVEKLSHELGEARKLKAASQAEKDRRLAMAPGCAIPAGNEEIVAWLQASKEDERRAQSARDQVNHEFQAVTDRVTSTREKWGTAKEALNKNHAKLLDLTGGIAQLVGLHGDTDQRRQLLGDAQALQLGMGTIVQTLKDQIAALNPESLEAGTNRLKRSREQLTRQLDEAHRQKAELDGKLSAFPSTDPRADLMAWEQRVRVLDAEHRSKQVRAAGIQSLKEEFQRAAHEVGQEVVRPLLERVNRLVRIVYGHGAELQIAETGESLGGLHLRRPDRGVHAFTELSAGTREQVAGIFRLALAELLAADHDGCLPMVLDDSFVNADPERMQRLHALLDAAAASGLQVILVTCDPLAHTTLGAQQVDLSGVSRNLQPGVYTVTNGPGGDSPDQVGEDGENDANTIAMSSAPTVASRRRKRGDNA